MLEGLLRGPVDASPCDNVAQWWPRHRDICLANTDPLSRAIAGGFAADRVGWAFASGYQAALHALFPGALFFVAARDEAASGNRISLKITRVDAHASGVGIEAMPPTKFVPEVPHAQLKFENVNIAEAEMLPGDGYVDYVKPFRTVEDIHVNAAILAYLVREARRLGWPDTWVERCCSLLLSLEKLAAENPNSPETHLALAGALAIGGGLIGEAEAFWQAAAPDTAAERWQRDRELLKVAAGIRAQRAKRAWENLRQPGPAG